MDKWILGILVNEENVYFVDNNNCFLTKINMNTLKVDERLPLSLEKETEYSKGVVVDENLIFTPWRMHEKPKILIYNEKKKEERYISLDEQYKINNHGFFYDVIWAKSSVYFIPFQYLSLVEYNFEQKKVLYYPEVVEKKYINKRDLNAISICRHAQIWNNHIIVMPYETASLVALFDIETHETLFWEPEGLTDGISNICIDGNICFLLTKNQGDIFIYNINTKALEKKISYEGECEEPFLEMLDCGGYLLVLQRNENYSFMLDKISYEMTYIESEEKLDGIKIDVLCSGIAKNGIVMTLRNKRSDYIGYKDLSKDTTIKWHKVPQLWQGNIYRSLHYDRICLEDEEARLKDFVTILVDK